MGFDGDEGGTLSGLFAGLFCEFRTIIQSIYKMPDLQWYKDSSSKVSGNRMPVEDATTFRDALFSLNSIGYFVIAALISMDGK